MEDIKEFLRGIFDTSLWPRRWVCGEWSDFHGWLYIISDFLIGLAYIGIPIVIASYVLKRDKDVQFRAIFWLFFAFILLCGFTHFMDVVIFWWPAYRLSAVIKFLTAVVSLGTLYALYKILPELMALKTAGEFQREISQRIKAEEELVEKNKEINRTVEELQKSQEQVRFLNKSLEERMYFLAESMPIMVWTADAGGNVDYFNGRYLDFTAKSMEQLKGLDWLHTIHRDDLEITKNAWELAVKNRSFYTVEHRIKRYDDLYHHFVAYGNPMLDEHDNIIMWVGGSIDINERKLAEQYLINSHEELKKLNSELDSFVYSISHEFRAPLSNIMGMTYVGKSAGDILFKNNVFLKIQHAAKTLDGYITNLLDYSRNARLPVDKKEIDFTAIINKCWESYQFLNIEKQVILKKNVTTDVAFFADEKRIEIIFNNLISNAIKYCDLSKPEPCIGITVKVEREEATIAIEDNGIGIEQKQLNRVLEMFFRASEHSQGSGLGLYIVKELVGRLKGNLKIISKPGVGTTVVLKFLNG